jgi:Ethanolamine utilization protein EutJ (predicted chaperonin)
MKSRTGLVLSLTILSILFSMGALQANEVAEKAAITASGAWLSLVDEGNYAESWNEAAGLFKAAVTKEQWQNTVRAVRVPLGKVVARKLKSKQYTKTLPGLPDGEYVVIQYETMFEKKQSAIETVTPMLDKDGKWRVSGYYIR